MGATGSDVAGGEHAINIMELSSVARTKTKRFTDSTLAELLGWSMGAFDRRSMLLASATVLAVTTIACENKNNEVPKTEPRPGPNSMVPLLVAIADRLVPTDEHGPGVKALGADAYFTQLLVDPRMKQLAPLLSRGAAFIDGAAKAATGQGFVALSEDARDEIVGRAANDQHRVNGFTPAAFVRVMVGLSLEAMLGDPRHGGNANQGGWTSVGGVSWAGRVSLSVLDGSR
jgi:hypothetical protein